MSYLIPNDYLPQIQSGNLNAIQVNNPAIRAQAELAATGEAVSMLRQKYDTTAEFTNTTAWAASGPGTIPGRAPLTAAAWVSGTGYAPGALVLYTDNNIYQSTANDNTGTPGGGNWLLLGPTGSTQYCAGDRVYLTAAPFSNTASYAFGDLILYTDGNVYQYTDTAFPVIGDFILSSWTLLGPQFTFFYAAFPVCVFDFANGVYKEGDEVFWNNHIYTCIKPTLLAGHEARLQVHEIEYLPYGNVFPTDPVNGLQWWGAGVPYVVPSGTGILNTTYWTQGDNRDQQMVQKLVDMTLFHLLSSVAPRNIPKLRRNRYMGEENDQVHENGEVIYPVYSALGWLQACARGSVMPALPVLQPPRGNRIRYGGTVRNVNSY